MAGLSLASAPALLPTSIFSLRRSHLSPGVCAPRRTPGARRMGSRLWRVLSPSVQVLSHLRSGHIKAPSSVMTDGRSHGKAWSLGHRLTDETAATGIQPPGWGGAGGVQRGGVCCPPLAPPPGGSQNLPHPRPPACSHSSQTQGPLHPIVQRGDRGPHAGDSPKVRQTGFGICPSCCTGLPLRAKCWWSRLRRLCAPTALLPAPTRDHKARFPQKFSWS